MKKFMTIALLAILAVTCLTSDADAARRRRAVRRAIRRGVPVVVPVRARVIVPVPVPVVSPAVIIR